MKALIIYDSKAQETKKIAEAIANGIEDCVTLVKGDHEVKLSDMLGLTLLIVGSGTIAMKPSPDIVRFLDTIPANGLDDVNVSAFDVRLEKEKIKKLIFRLVSDGSGYAARPIAEKLRKKGGTLVLLPEPFFLEEESGPLKEGELERAVLWGRLACHA
jgi:flavodoxin